MRECVDVIHHSSNMSDKMSDKAESSNKLPLVTSLFNQKNKSLAPLNTKLTSGRKCCSWSNPSSSSNFVPVKKKLSVSTMLTSNTEQAQPAAGAERAFWETCSRNNGTQVRILNVQEHNRLTQVERTLDKQLERELRRLTIERDEFRDVLEHFKQHKGLVSPVNLKKSSPLSTSTPDVFQDQRAMSDRYGQGRISAPGSGHLKRRFAVCTRPILSSSSKVNSSATSSRP